MILPLKDKASGYMSKTTQSPCPPWTVGEMLGLVKHLASLSCPCTIKKHVSDCVILTLARAALSGGQFLH